MNSPHKIQLRLKNDIITFVVVGATCAPADKENGWAPHPDFLSVYVEGDPEQTNLFPRGWTLEPTATVAKHRLYDQICARIIFESTE